MFGWTYWIEGYVAHKDMKAFENNLKTIYTASDEEAARGRLEDVTDK